MLFRKLHVASKLGFISPNPITLKVSNWKKKDHLLSSICFLIFVFLYMLSIRSGEALGEQAHVHQHIDAQSIHVHSSSRWLILLKEFLLCFIMDIFLSWIVSSTLQVFTQCFILVKKNLVYIRLKIKKNMNNFISCFFRYRCLVFSQCLISILLPFEDSSALWAFLTKAA